MRPIAEQKLPRQKALTRHCQNAAMMVTTCTHLCLKASSNRASRMFSSGSHVLYLLQIKT